MVFRPDHTPHPERFDSRVVDCDLGTRGAARVAVAVRNGDRTRHAYKVDVVVDRDGAPIGAGAGLVNRVRPGATATARALVPLRGEPTGANCHATATLFSGTAGHHS
jgi:hypothetical protein